jgi:hypothetical protein
MNVLLKVYENVFDNSVTQICLFDAASYKIICGRLNLYIEFKKTILVKQASLPVLPAKSIILKAIN